MISNYDFYAYYYHAEAFSVQPPQQLVYVRQTKSQRIATAQISSTNRLSPLQISSTDPSSFPPYRPSIQPPATPLTGDANIMNSVPEAAPTLPPPRQPNPYSRRGMAGKKGGRRVTLRRYLNGLVKTHPEVGY